MLCIVLQSVFLYFTLFLSNNYEIGYGSETVEPKTGRSYPDSLTAKCLDTTLEEMSFIHIENMQWITFAKEPRVIASQTSENEVASNR